MFQNDYSEATFEELLLCEVLEITQPTFACQNSTIEIQISPKFTLKIPEQC